MGERLARGSAVQLVLADGFPERVDDLGRVAADLVDRQLEVLTLQSRRRICGRGLGRG